MTLHRGGCHCGDVAFEVEAPAAMTVQECNCSICAMTGFLHLIVPASRFYLARGEEALGRDRNSLRDAGEKRANFVW